MTCIVGVVNNGKIYFGADSQMSDGNLKLMVSDEKVFIKSNIIFGVAGNCRFSKLLKYYLDIPPQDDGMSDIFYLHHMIVENIRKLALDYGYSEKENNQESINSYTIIGYKDTIYSLDAMFSLSKIDIKYWAEGTGRQVALGVMYNLRNENMPIKEKILKALEASEYFSSGVSYPFQIYELGKPSFETYDRGMK